MLLQILFLCNGTEHKSNLCRRFVDSAPIFTLKSIEACIFIPAFRVKRLLCNSYPSNVTKAVRTKLFSAINFKLWFIIFSLAYCYFPELKHSKEVNNSTKRAIRHCALFQETPRSKAVFSIPLWIYRAYDVSLLSHFSGVIMYASRIKETQGYTEHAVQLFRF